MRDLLRTAAFKSASGVIYLAGAIVVVVTLIAELCDAIRACVITPVATARRVVHRLVWALGA